MSSSIDDRVRRVIPRWRTSAASSAQGELDSLEPGPQGVEIVDPERLARSEREWQSERTTPFASELVGGALLAGGTDYGLDAAEYLLREDSDAPAGAREIALSLRALAGIPRSPASRTVAKVPDENAVRTQLRRLRQELGGYPRNPLAWSDLSLLYSSVGEAAKSQKAMNLALALAPDSRFVLRAASRLFVHANEPDRAHDLLRRSGRGRRDPWILAAQLACGQVAGITPRDLKTARALLESKRWGPRHTAELAAALASIELEAGKTKSARKLFQAALVDPTENSVAQVGWAARQHKIPSLIVSAPVLARSSEATAMRCFTDGQWAEALVATLAWLSEEQFSTRPAMHASYIAAIALEDYPVAAKLATLGLIANPQEVGLKNNLAFAMAMAGQADSAAAILDSANTEGGGDAQQATLLATRGLIEFRRGQYEGGRLLYSRAFALYQGGRDPRLAALAALHWAREELLAKSRDAHEIGLRALELAKNSQDADILLLRERIAETVSKS